MSCFIDHSIPKVTLKDISYNYLEDYDKNQCHELIIIRSELWTFVPYLYITVGIIIGKPGNLEFVIGNLNSAFTPASSGVCLLPEQLLCLWCRKLLFLRLSPQRHIELSIRVHRATCWFPRTHHLHLYLRS